MSADFDILDEAMDEMVRADRAEALVAELLEALEEIASMHVDNPSFAMADISRADYIEFLLINAKARARNAIAEAKGEQS